MNNHMQAIFVKLMADTHHHFEQLLKARPEPMSGPCYEDPEHEIFKLFLALRDYCSSVACILENQEARQEQPPDQCN